MLGSASHDPRTLAQPLLDTFVAAVLAAGRTPAFLPNLELSTTPGPIRYDHDRRAIVLIPWRILSSPAQASMARIGTLGLSPEDHYAEIFHRLLIPHELAHWLQTLAARPLSRWHAELGANRIMVGFWREHPDPHTSTDLRLHNFTAEPPTFPPLRPAGSTLSLEDTFNSDLAAIEQDPARYAAFQKHLVREAMAEHPAPTLCYLIQTTWPA